MTTSPQPSEQYVPLAESISKLVKFAHGNNTLIELLIDLSRVDQSFNDWVAHDLKRRDISDKIEEALEFYEKIEKKAAIIAGRFASDENITACISDLGSLTENLLSFR